MYIGLQRIFVGMVLECIHQNIKIKKLNYDNWTNWKKITLLFHSSFYFFNTVVSIFLNSIFILKIKQNLLEIKQHSLWDCQKKTCIISQGWGLICFLPYGSVTVFCDTLVTIHQNFFCTQYASICNLQKRKCNTAVQ